jgi:hypothetical protein
MRFYCFIAFILSCISLVQPVCAADKDDPSKKPKNYADAAEECDKAIEQHKHELAGQYSTDVWMLKDKFQKAGDLEKALILDKEWSRSLSRKPLTQEHLVESLPELASLQREYIPLFTKVAETVATEFLQDLKKESSDLAKSGKLAEGRVLQQEIDTIKKLYLDGKNEKPAAESKADGDPVAACEELIRQSRVAMQAQYVGELEAIERASQAKGALEDIFAVKAERQRYLETPILAESNLVETPLSLRELQDTYLERQEGLAAKVVEEVVERLEQQKQSLTIEGRLEDAMKAKLNSEKIRKRYLAPSDEDRMAQALRAATSRFRWDDWRRPEPRDVAYGKWYLEGKDLHGGSSSLVDGAVGDWSYIGYARPLENFCFSANVRLQKRGHNAAGLCLSFGDRRDWQIALDGDKWKTVKMNVRGREIALHINGVLERKEIVQYPTSSLLLKVHCADVVIRDLNVAPLR